MLGICGGDASPVSSGKRRGAEVQTPVCSDEVQSPGKRRSAEVQTSACSDEVQSFGGKRRSVEVPFVQ